jgi:thiamine biosynthesis lipoprotein
MSLDDRERLEDAIKKRLEMIDRIASLYRSDSELSRFNQQNTTETIPVSTNLLQIIETANEVSRQTFGAFDVTVAPLVNAWKKAGETNPPGEITTETINELRDEVGYEKLELDPGHSTIRKFHPGVTCDLNGIAQGYTVDKLLADLTELGYNNLLVEIGGEVKGIGNGLEENPWSVAIPEGNGEKVILNNVAISTSGFFHNDTLKDNPGWIIDPRSALPVKFAYVSICVIHPMCVMADAYATAFVVLGPDAGFKFAREHKLPVRFIVEDEQKNHVETITPEFMHYLAH